MNKPRYAEIANNYSLWGEFIDPSGVDSEADFDGQTTEEKVAIIEE